MSAHDDGGAAFPHPDYLHQGPDGMTLRDYFAAHAPALPAPIRDAFVTALKRGAEVDLSDHAEVCARWSILYADSMLKARRA
jgi:hypothetical protein